MAPLNYPDGPHAAAAVVVRMVPWLPANWFPKFQQPMDQVCATVNPCGCIYRTDRTSPHHGASFRQWVLYRDMRNLGSHDRGSNHRDLSAVAARSRQLRPPTDNEVRVGFGASIPGHVAVASGVAVAFAVTGAPAILVCVAAFGPHAGVPERISLVVVVAIGGHGAVHALD